MKKFDDAQVLELLRDFPQWTLEDGKLVRTLQLSSFANALTFVTRVAALAEEQNHHPDIDIRYDRVTLRLNTHDAGGITGRDGRMAEAIDKLSGLELDEKA